MKTTLLFDFNRTVAPGKTLPLVASLIVPLTTLVVLVSWAKIKEGEMKMIANSAANNKYLQQRRAKCFVRMAIFLVLVTNEGNRDEIKAAI